jgi:methanethiol S-methyltransferase
MLNCDFHEFIVKGEFLSFEAGCLRGAKIMPNETENNISDPTYSKALARALLISANIFGISSLLMWLAFVFHGGFDIVKSDGMSEARIFIIDACLSLLFFVQHSTMARSSFQRRLSEYVHKDLHGAVYTICTGIPLLAASILWEKSAIVLIPIHGAYRYIMHFIFFIGFAGFHWGVKSLGTFDIFGIGAIQRRLKGEQPPPTVPFTIRGPYRIVRHPLYLATLLMIWSCPDLTTDRLLYNIIWSIWIIIGTVLEEKELRNAFGEDYTRYQKEVPMLVPWRIRLYKGILR